MMAWTVVFNFMYNHLRPKYPCRRDQLNHRTLQTWAANLCCLRLLGLLASWLDRHLPSGISYIWHCLHVLFCQTNSDPRVQSIRLAKHRHLSFGLGFWQIYTLSIVNNFLIALFTNLITFTLITSLITLITDSAWIKFVINVIKFVIMWLILWLILWLNLLLCD